MVFVELAKMYRVMLWDFCGQFYALASTAAIAAILIAGVWPHRDAVAQERFLYSCRAPGTGQTLTADRPPLECFNRTVIRQFNSKGLLVREIEPQLTPEQRREKQLVEEKARSEVAAQAEQRRRDRAFLVIYPNGAAIEEARRRGLAVVETSIKVSKDRIVLLERERKVLADEEEYYPNRPLPGTLKRKISDVEAALDRERRSLIERDLEIVRTNQRFDEEKKRYQILTQSVPSRQ